MAEPALEPPCADAIGIVANPTEAKQLRSLLRKGSLSSLRAEACQHYEARLLHRPLTTGFTVSMTSSNSPRKLERQVTTLAHAAIWLEAWAQSGFAPAPEAAVSRTSPLPPDTAAGPGAPPSFTPFVGAGPVAMLTTRGYGLAGGSLHLGVPSRHTPWVGATLGLATDVAATGVDFRRVVWAGPALGANAPVTTNLRLQPMVSTGVFSASAKNADMTSNSVGAYAALGADLVWDLNSNLAVFAGIEGRLILTNFLGGATNLPKHHHSDDDDNQESAALPVDPAVGLFGAGLRLGVIWNFGAS